MRINTSLSKSWTGPHVPRRNQPAQQDRWGQGSTMETSGIVHSGVEPVLDAREIPCYLL